MLNNAHALDDLRVLGRNRFEMLRGDRADECSIRINEQWRACVVWDNGDSLDVEIVDYH